MRKNLGAILISCGFLLGAYFSVIHMTKVMWISYVISLALGVIGIYIVALDRKKIENESSYDVRSIISIEQSLDKIVKILSQMMKGLKLENTRQVRKDIDELLLADLDNIINLRRNIIFIYDLQSYSDIMNDFSCGERYLNRVWCASADGYYDEVVTFLAKAHAQFLETQKKLNLAKSDFKQGHKMRSPAFSASAQLV